MNTLYAPRVFGGAERIVQLLAEGLVEAGHEVVVVATVPGRGVTTRELNGVRIREVGLRNVYWPYGERGAPPALEPIWHALDLRNPWMARLAAEVLADEDPDVLHTHGLVGFSPGVWTVATEQGLPVVHTVHDHRLLCVRATMFKRGRACATRCIECRVSSRLKRGRADAVDVAVGVGEAVLERHVEAGFFASAETDVIPPAVSPPATPSKRTPAEDGILRLGYLGRLQPGKGVEELLAAAGMLPPEGWDLRIAGAGEAGYVERVRSLPAPPGVRFVGRVEAYPFLRGLDALVVPSRLREGAGLVVLEAHAHGVPVIGAHRGGIAELVEDGRTGHLYDADSPAALAQVLRGLIGRPARVAEMRDACLAHAEDHRPEQAVEAYLRCYLRAVERRETGKRRAT